MRLRVRLKEVDDEFPFRSLDLSHGSQNIATPIKACDMSIPVSPVTEIHRHFKTEQLKRVMSDEGYERRLNSDLRRMSGAGLNILLVDIIDSAHPSTEVLETVSDIQYANSDLVVTPLCSILPRELRGHELLEGFLDVTNRFLEIVETQNHKSIVGAIPSRMPRQMLAPILSNFHAHGATAIVIDFDGRSVMTNPSWIRSLTRLMAESGALDESFLYSVNASEGKFLKNADRVLAKDFMGSGFGLDILGLNHITPKLSTEQWKRIKAKRRSNLLRLFDRTDYSYYRQREDELMGRWGVQANEVNTARRAYNIKEQHEETLVLQRLLGEESSLERYLRTKELVDDGLLKKMRTLKRDAREGGTSKQDALF